MSPPEHVLVTIPPSHYCERARWALDYAGIAFKESQWPPLLHMAGVAGPLLRSGQHTVPLLHVLGDSAAAAGCGTVLQDSADIVDYADKVIRRRAELGQAPGAGAGPGPLYPDDPALREEVLQLERQFASQLGVWTRVVAYYDLFQDRRRTSDVLACRQPGVGPVGRAFVTACLPLLRGMISKGFGVNADRAARCLERTKEVFEQVAQRLQAPGSNGFLVGGRFTAADLTFASMAAVVVLPPQYGAYLGELGALPHGSPVRELRASPAGQHVLRMFEAHRHADAGGACNVRA